MAKAHGNAGALSVEQHRRTSQRGVEMLNAYGITAFQDAAVSLEMLTALRSLDEAAELNAWVESSMTVNDQIFGFDPVGQTLIALGEEFRTLHHPRTQIIALSARATEHLASGQVQPTIRRVRWWEGEVIPVVIAKPLIL